jgi:hypothetical protein
MKKIKKDIIRIKEKDTKEYTSLIKDTLDDMFDGAFYFNLKKPLHLIIFECFMGKVISDEKEKKYRLLLLETMADLLEGVIQNVKTFEPEHVITKNRSIN